MAKNKKQHRSDRDIQTRPVDDEAHPRAPLPTSGTLSSNTDSDSLSVADPGVSVDPEDLGAQFLRDATEQDNFESEVEGAELNPAAYPLGQMISEATLESAGQGGSEWPESSSLSAASDATFESDIREVGMTSNAVRLGSLFDEPKDTNDMITPQTREPALETDEMATFDEHRPPPGVDADAREEEMARMRASLRNSKDRRSPSDNETWQDNRRRAGGGSGRG